MLEQKNNNYISFRTIEETIYIVKDDKLISLSLHNFNYLLNYYTNNFSIETDLTYDLIISFLNLLEEINLIKESIYNYVIEEYKELLLNQILETENRLDYLKCTKPNKYYKHKLVIFLRVNAMVFVLNECKKLYKLENNKLKEDSVYCYYSYTSNKTVKVYPSYYCKLLNLINKTNLHKYYKVDNFNKFKSIIKNPNSIYSYINYKQLINFHSYVINNINN